MKTNTKNILTLCLAIFYIIYGMLKIAIGLLILLLPTEIIVKIPIFNYFADVISDKTLAGHFYDYILCFFGAYTIIYGLSLLNMFSQNVTDFIDNKTLIYTIYYIFGIIILIFYSLVLFTDVPISKDLKKHKLHYQIYGFVGGISFMLIPILWQAIIFLHPIYKQLSQDTQLIIISVAIIIISFISNIIYTNITKTNTIPINI